MSKDPAFLFYSSDFLTGTMFMTNEQVGKYIRLLCAQHQKGHLSEKDMLNICGSHDEDILSKFVKDSDGKFYNERCEIEINKRKKYSESRSNNRKSTTKTKKHMKNISKSYVKHMENENVIENINENKKGIEIKKEIVLPFNSENFIKVWDVLIRQPKWKKKSNDALIAACHKLSKFDEKVAIKMMMNTIEGGWQGLFEIDEKQLKEVQQDSREAWRAKQMAIILGHGNS